MTVGWQDGSASSWLQPGQTCPLTPDRFVAGTESHMKRVLQYLILGPSSTLPLEIWWGTAHVRSDLSRSKGEKCRWPVPATEEEWEF